jgi:hypothetical protein
MTGMVVSIAAGGPPPPVKNKKSWFAQSAEVAEDLGGPFGWTVSGCVGPPWFKDFSLCDLCVLCANQIPSSFRRVALTEGHAAAPFFLRELGILCVKRLYRSIKPFPLKFFR